MGTFARILGAACLALLPGRGVSPDQHDRGHGQGHVRRRPARRHGRSRQPRADRESSIGDHRRIGPVSDHPAAARHLHRHASRCPGFSVVKRENVELTSDFTATINADMKVGAVEETITVSAESPIVDVQNITDAHRDDARRARRDPHRAQHPGGRHHDSRHDHRRGRRRRAVARRRRLGQPAAVSAAVPRFGRHGPDHRRACA